MKQLMMVYKWRSLYQKLFALFFSQLGEHHFYRLLFKHQNFSNRDLCFGLIGRAQLKITHTYFTSLGPLWWSQSQGKCQPCPVYCSHCCLIQSKQSLPISDRKKCMFNKAAVQTAAALKPLFFYLWWLQVVLGGSLLSHSDWQLMRCRGLKVNTSSLIIYGSSLWQNTTISLIPSCR